MINSITLPAIDVINVEFFDEGLVIMVAHYCRNNGCHQNVIKLYNMNLTYLQALFSESNFLNLIQYENEPRLLTCLPQECSIYKWENRHFSNPYTISMDFQLAEVRTQYTHVFMRSSDNILHLYSRKDNPKFEAWVNLTNNFGNIQINAIATDFDKVYLIVTSINETSVQFQFFDIKNDTNLILGSEIFPNLSDPFDEIEGCANRLKRQFDQSYSMITKVNAVLPKIITTTKKVHFSKVTVNNTVTIKSGVSVGEEIRIRTDANFNADKAVGELERISNRTREAKERSDQLVLIDDPTPRANTNDATADGSSLLIAHTIRVKNLQTTDPFFNNLIRRTGRNFLKGNLTVSTLISPQVDVRTGVVNNVVLNDLYLNGQSRGPIQGKKTIQDVRVDRLTIDESLNGIGIRQLTEWTRDLSNKKELRLKRVRARNLTVTTINGVRVDTFFRDYYRSRPDLNSSIKGNLLVTKPIHITNLMTRYLNSVPIPDYFRLKADQVIHRKVIFKDFFVRNVNANLINGIEFGKSVVVQGEKNVIESPVRIYQMKVENKLTLSDQENRAMTQHIVGTRVEDLSQSYNGRVVINGDLTLHNVTIENVISLFLDDKKFPLDSLSEYWTRNTSQRITKNVIFKGRISTSQLLAEQINNHPVSAFVTTDQDILQTDSNIRFLDTIIERNIRTRDVSKILEISRNVVRKGKRTVIEGAKHFQNISTQNLTSSFINGQQISSHFLNLHTSLKCSRHITFDELHLQSDLESPPTSHLQIETIDQVNMRSLFADTVYINRPVELASIAIDEFVADGDLKVESLNGVDATGALERINNLRFMVNVTGNAIVQRLFADTVNGVRVRDYFNMVVRNDRVGPQELGGKKTFLQGFSVLEELRVRDISGVDVNQWMANVLRWDGTETVVTEEWVFKEVEARSVYAARINEMPTKWFINSRERVTLHKDLHVNELIVQDTVITARGAHNWTRVIERLRNPMPRKWQRIEVTGNIRMPQPVSKLGELIHHGVNNRQSQSFSGDLFFRGRVKIKNLFTHNRTINGIDLRYVLQDTLLDNTQEVQIVTGAVVFEKGFSAMHLRATDMNVVRINDVDMIDLDKSLWRPGTETTFPWLHFPKISVDRLKINGTINGVFPHDLNTIDHVGVDSYNIAPNFTVLGSLTVDSINGMPFDYFIGGTARLKSKKAQHFLGFITFENLVIRGNFSKLRGINGIPISSLLLSKSRQTQDVTGIQGFKSISFSGPSSITSLNDVPLSEMYKWTVDKRRNQDLTLFNARQVIVNQGLTIHSTLNDIPIQFFTKEPPQLPNIKDMQHRLETILAQDIDTRKGRKKRFNYFDYAHNFDVTPDGNDSSNIVLKRYTSRDCQGSTGKCLCKRQVEIQLSKFNEIQVHPTKDIRFEGRVGDRDIQILVNNSCDPDQVKSTLIVTSKDNVMRGHQKGITKLIGSIGSTNSSIFVTATENKENLTIVTWNVTEENILKKIHSLVFARSTRSHVHLMQHLLIISTTTASQPSPHLSWVYRYDPLSNTFKLQQILRSYYNLLSSVGSDKDSFLAAGLSGERVLDLYKVNETSQLSSRKQIAFLHAIKDVLALRGQDEMFVAILLENAHLLIYRYSFVEVSSHLSC